MTELRLMKTPLALAAVLAASAAFAQMAPAPMTAPETAGTAQAAPSAQGPITSSTDPLIQKRIDDKAAKDEYKARKAEAKATYKREVKYAKSIRKAEKMEASAKRRATLPMQGGPAQTPGSSGE